MPISKGNNGTPAPTVEKNNGTAIETTPLVSTSVYGKRNLTPNLEVNEALTGADKDTRILRSGVYQAVLHSPVLGVFPITNEDDYLKKVEYVAEKVIKLVQG